MSDVPIFDNDGNPTGQLLNIDDICHPWPGTEREGFHEVHPKFSAGLPSHVLVKDEDIVQATI